jgi:thiamine pyrophosphokinase
VSSDPTEQQCVVIVTGGAPLLAAAVQTLPADAFIIAADSGLDHALGAGLRADLVVGDLDSISESALAWAEAMGVPIEQHPADKDATDTELALAHAISRGATHICLVAGESYRLDHTIGALTALGHTSLAPCRSVEARWGPALVHVVHGPRTRTFELATGVTFSLLALHGECRGVTLTGAQWPLADAVIAPGSSLAVSNLSTEPAVRVGVEHGVLTVIFPDYFGGHL